MKRLVKKASVNLNHATTLESFIGICESQSIDPHNDVANKVKNSNSSDQDSVYLSRSSGIEFANEMKSEDKYSSAVSLTVNVDEGSLLPAYDNIFDYGVYDTGFDENNEEYFVDDSGDQILKKDLTWQDTLEIAEECRYKGSIPISNIASVTFVSNNSSLNLPRGAVSIEEAQEIIKSIKE